MFKNNDWKDYELLDATNGERLERWGKYILRRPDPQIIWKNAASHKAWKNADAIYKRSSGGGGGWSKNTLPATWNISYGNLKFCLKPMGFKHTGLFPEQAANWDWFSDLIRKAGRPIKVLNLFAYTGGATVAAAKAGASVVHVDASKGIVAQAKENATLSGLAEAPIRYIVDDCKKFVEREIRRGNKYDGIIMDPPSYGRGPNGEVWKLEQQLGELLSETGKLLSDDAIFFFLNSYTGGLSPTILNYMVKRYVAGNREGEIFTDEIGLYVTDKGISLPCGNTTVWKR